MAGRTSARSAAAQDQASSPPKQFNLQSQSSSIAQRTRSRRSRSVELGGSDREITQKRPGKRATRQGSAESDSSVASNRGRRTRQAARNTVARDLSMVAEDAEEHRLESESSEGEANDHIGGLQAFAGHLQSPGANSQMSGTTAFSADPSLAGPEMEKLDSMAVENLPDLFQASRKLLDLLAPRNFSPGRVEATVKDLLVPGSRFATKLKFNEDKFNLLRKLYEPELEPGQRYIKVRYIVRSLLGTPNPLEEDCRPDEILYAANLATLVKECLVIEKESEKARRLLMDLDSPPFRFPGPFLESFDQKVEFGKSLLVEESFDLMLDIRTQFIIAALRHQRDDDNFAPEELLIAGLYDEPADRDPELDFFQDVVTNGRPRGIGLVMSKDQVDKVYERATLIRSTFRQNKDARQIGELVEFDQLEDQFPWLEFLTRLVEWSRLRLTEILQKIEQQGGINNIMSLLIEAIKLNDSQNSIDYEVPPSAKRRLQPPVGVAQEPLIQSAYSKSNARIIESLRQHSSSFRGQSSLPPLNKPSKSQKAVAHAPDIGNVARNAPNDFDLRDMNDDDIDHDFNPPASSYVIRQDAYNKERNKENRLNGQNSDTRTAVQQSRQTRGNELPKIVQPSTYDRQHNAEKVPRSSQGSDGRPSTQKRPRTPPIEDEESSEDEGFEQDTRQPDPLRRRAAQRDQPSRDGSPPSKRARQHARVHSEDELEDVDPPRPGARAKQQASPRQVDEDEDVDDEVPPPTAREVGQAARLEALKRRMGRAKPQYRRFWTDKDTEYLIDAVGRYGCCWSVIEKLPDWEIKRNQVALKDKGRNLKTQYLVGGTELPENFDQIRLSKKEIARVKAIIPDFEQDPI